MSKRGFKNIKNLNNDCITPCYPPGTSIYNPYTMSAIPTAIKPVCGVIPFRKGSDVFEFKACDMSTQIDLMDTQYFSMPRFLLTKYQFLEGAYDIHSFDDTVDWTIDNPDKPYYTIKRIHDISWLSFGSDLLNITNKVKEYYYNLLVNVWMIKYYIILKKKYRMKIVDGALQIEKKDVVDEDGKKNVIDDSYDKTEDVEINAYTNSESIREIINAIVSQHLRYSQFVELLVAYIKSNADGWEDVDSHYNDLIIYFYKYLASEI